MFFLWCWEATRGGCLPHPGGFSLTLRLTGALTFLRTHGNRTVHGTDTQGVPPEERARHLFVCLCHNVAERLPRYPHPSRGVRLIQIFDVGQTHRFEFVKRQLDLVEKPQRNTLRLEIARTYFAGYPPTFHGSWHKTGVLGNKETRLTAYHTLVAYAN